MFAKYIARVMKIRCTGQVTHWWLPWPRMRPNNLLELTKYRGLVDTKPCVRCSALTYRIERRLPTGSSLLRSVLLIWCFVIDQSGRGKAALGGLEHSPLRGRGRSWSRNCICTSGRRLVWFGSVLNRISLAETFLLRIWQMLPFKTWATFVERFCDIVRLTPPILLASTSLCVCGPRVVVSFCLAAETATGVHCWVNVNMAWINQDLLKGLRVWLEWIKSHWKDWGRRACSRSCASGTSFTEMMTDPKCATAIIKVKNKASRHFNETNPTSLLAHIDRIRRFEGMQQRSKVV